ncbi:MAG: GBS Bsp-like repeat-containing protein, partial [Atopobiaceae bacterium]|nr:GBS Bsp-like repeat-containing protein [Atopobiaceae bacterium]
MTLGTTITGTQQIDAYGINIGEGANDCFGNGTAVIATETEKPVISEVKVVNVTPKGYRVSCKVTDNVGVTDVRFPTWTAHNGQDDIGEWGRYGTKVGDIYTFDVNVGSHNNEHGIYHTHIYAYDAAGNSAASNIPTNVLVPDRMLNNGGSTYYLFEDNLSWKDARERCANAHDGGHLVTIESPAENEVVAGFAQQGDKNAYWIGASDEESEGSWKWVTGETVEPIAWADTEPNGGTTENALAINNKNDPPGMWCDYTSGNHSDFGFIMEVDGGAFEQQGEVVTDIEDGVYTINMFADQNYAVDVAEGATGSGCNAQLWTANGTDYQRWRFTKNDDDTYTIVNIKSDCALDVQSGNQGSNANVWVYESIESAAQRWYVERDGTGSYFLRAKCSNCYLDVAGYSFGNGCNMITWYANGNNQQRYKLMRSEHAKAVGKRIYDVTPDGYKMEVKFETPGMDSTRAIDGIVFPTWTAPDGQDDILWEEGSIDGDIVTFEVRTTKHAGQTGCTYHTHVYVRDAYGNHYNIGGAACYVPQANRIASYGSSTYYLVENADAFSWEQASKAASSVSFTDGRQDAHLVTIESAEEQEAVEQLAKAGSREAYYIGLNDAKAEGQWTWVNGTLLSSYANWADGEPNGGSAESYAALNRTDGFWCDNSGVTSNRYGYIAEVEGEDRCAPSINNVTVTDLDETGYTVTCAVSDPSGVSKVEFPTWVPEKGEVGDNALWKEGELYEDPETGDTVAEFRVSAADHGNAAGEYATHIYATDKLGNKTKQQSETKVETIYVPDAVFGSQNAVYYRFDHPGSWNDAKTLIEAMPLENAQLATVASEGDNDALASLLAGAGKSAYWLGLSDADGTGTFTWADGGEVKYNHWASGQPGTYTGARYGAVLTSNGKWYGYADAGVNNKPENMGFIAMVGYSEDNPCPDGHTWGEWKTTVEPTCNKVGYRERVCDVCGEFEVEQIPALGHDPMEATRQNEVAATCEEDGSYESVVVCSRCGEELSRETVKADKLGHAPADPVEENRVEPTCSAEGSRELVTYCGRCGKELGREPETLPKAEHAPADAVEENRVEPTCSKEGSYDLVAYCTVCGAEAGRETVAVPKSEHAWGEGELTTRPTCTEPGERTFTCAGCGEKRTEGVEATGHRLGKPVTENESDSNTCTEGGTYDEVVYCEVCHEELSREQKAQPAGQHVPVTDSAVAPTCTKAGLTEGSHCQVCGTVLVAQEPVAAPGHEEEHVDAVAPSCTEPGATEGTRCATCGEVLSGCEPIAALGHDYREAVVEPTCTQAGHTEHRCTRCGDTYVTDRVPAKAHTAGDPEVASEVPASCEAVGSRVLVTKCADCGKELYRTTQTIPATGHKAGEPVVESETKATCETAGRKVTVTKCADCDHELTRTVEVTPATGHKAGEPVVESETPATCEEAGARTLVTKCAGCGKELSRQTEAVPAKGHSWDEGRVTKEPTCTEQGLRAFTCTACGATTTERVPTADHRPGAESRENEVASTCSAPGHYEAVTHCADCGVELSRQTVPLPLGDHAWGS